MSGIGGRHGGNGGHGPGGSHTKFTKGTKFGGQVLWGLTTECAELEGALGDFYPQISQISQIFGGALGVVLWQGDVIALFFPALQDRYAKNCAIGCHGKWRPAAERSSLHPPRWSC